MSGFTEEVIIPALATGLTFGAYAVYKAGELMVRGAVGLVKVTGEGAKALASAIAEQQRIHRELMEQKRVERDKKREDERLAALGNLKMVAEERIRSIIRDSNESADKLSQLISTARSEVQGVQRSFGEIEGGNIFDCSKALKRFEEIEKGIGLVQSRLESDDTVAVLLKKGDSISNAEQSQQVRDFEKTLHGNGELVAELQVNIASARMECEALKKCALALCELQKDLSELSFELTVGGALYQERINKIKAETDVTDYESIMQAYRATGELMSQLKNTSETAQNARLAAFLNSRLAVIQDRLNSIRAQAVERADDSILKEFVELAAQAEELYAVLSDGRLDYKSGILAEKMRTLRINVRAQNDIVAVRNTVNYLKAEVDIYEDLCAECEKYNEVKDECDELAFALGYDAEVDFFSTEKSEMQHETDRLTQLKQTYLTEIAERRRATLLARSSVDFAREEYEFLGEFEVGDEDGSVQLLYARRGEVGAIHVVQADLNGYVCTFTTGVNIVKDGASLTTSGSATVKKACRIMRETHVKNIQEFNRIIGLEKEIPVIADIDPDSPEAAEYPCVTFDESVNGELLEEYLKAVNARLYIENGELKLKEIDDGTQDSIRIIKGTGSGRRSGERLGGANSGALAVDPNKK